MKPAQVAYAILFVVVIPAILVLWARATAPLVQRPLPPALVGHVAVAMGSLLVLAGWHALWRRGGGLPMNAFPPPRFVADGVYAYLRHPIYVGFSLLVGGVAIAAGSSSGLWLVWPIATAGAWALVLGYEVHDLERRFGPRPPHRLALPPDDDAPPTPRARAAIFVRVLVPWLAVYQLVLVLGPAPDAVSSWLPFERDWPVIEWTEIVYLSSYVIVPLVPLVARTHGSLRHFATTGLVALAINALLLAFVPLIAPARPFEPTSIWGELLALERRLEGASGEGTFPSYHVTWSFTAAAFYAREFPRLRWLAWTWALASSASCATTGMHSLVDLPAGFLVFLVGHRARDIWTVLLRWTESVANSWREWRIGPVRVISHGAFGGAGAFVAILCAATFSGVSTGWIVLLGAMSLVGAALWAQLVEGASVSLRPFGYYGSVVGAIAAGGVIAVLGGPAWLLLASLAVGAPWAQALGRLRCLVQGCCHGRECAPELGIRYHHPRSRVTRLSTLGGVPVHPTQLYSIVANIVSGVILVRLALLELPPPFIAGMYLILAGLSRFVEESYRGEPQTPAWRGLAIYQWNAIVSVLLGIGATCVRSVATWPGPVVDARALGLACGFAIATTLAMGVDFPASNRRFARLVK